MTATLEQPAAHAAWPHLTYEVRVMDDDEPVDITATEQHVNVVISDRLLTPRGAYYLTVATRENLARGLWSGSTRKWLTGTETSGHIVPSPQVLFEATAMDHAAPVAIIDGRGHLRVLVDDRELSHEGAHFLTLAVRKHMATGYWRRDND